MIKKKSGSVTSHLSFAGSSWVGPGKPNLPLGLRGKAGGGARVSAPCVLCVCCVCVQRVLCVCCVDSVCAAAAKLLQSCPTLWTP